MSLAGRNQLMFQAALSVGKPRRATRGRMKHASVTKWYQSQPGGPTLSCMGGMRSYPPGRLLGGLGLSGPERELGLARAGFKSKVWSPCLSARRGRSEHVQCSAKEEESSIERTSCPGTSTNQVGETVTRRPFDIHASHGPLPSGQVVAREPVNGECGLTMHACARTLMMGINVVRPFELRGREGIVH